MNQPQHPDTNSQTPDCQQTSQPIIINIDQRSIVQAIKWGFLAYFGVYAFAILVGLLCAGGMLLVGSILAATR